MNATKVNSFIASMRPLRGEGVKTYLAAAVRALGGRSDADLARTMGVPAPTVASWKRRGGVPDEHTSWFTTSLAEKVLLYRSAGHRADPISDAGVIELIVRTGGNPLGLPRGGIQATPYALPGLFALSAFLLAVNEAEWEGKSDVDKIDALADLLEGAMALEGRHAPVPSDLLR